ncbi:SHOCT domain-containing protein [Actinomadura barringtoniae]|uniref:SHOCT domain-containing protein n=1 Tax=Actinomadura barringtoniae TaxID=1427535 RepID=A0A939P6D8_9ACTN|nr:SHOCT domain-containing protein [Actinomadura barringtoniae]MBO2446025.1 SHOCT domain-containing protein [Actinomadura barringtoniae]
MDDYPLLNLFWTMLWFFLWVMWLFLLFRVIMDIFSSDDLSGWGKAGWTVLVLVLPYLGVLIYLIARGASMTRRQAEQAAKQEQTFQNYIRETAGTAGSAPNTAEQLEKFADLKARGEITDEEYQQAKTKILT